MITANKVDIKPTYFPDNTTQVWKLPEDLLRTPYVLVKWRFTHEGEILHLAQLKDLLDANHVRSDLLLEYLPFGRQDKEIRNDATFALTSFANLLNSMAFDRVYCIDPHSDIAGKVIDNFRTIYPKKQVDDLLRIHKYDLLCYPDMGAKNKYATKVYPRVPYISASKLRNHETGEIIDYCLCGFGVARDKRVLIVDDICDGGATFIKLADLLISDGAANIDLFVSHGIFSKGLRPIYQSGIQRIFTKQGEASEVQGNLCYKPITVEVTDEQYIANANV